jgi:DNA mismatch repair protein MSH5
VLPEDFHHIFNENDEAFFKNDETNNLDENMGDLHAFIKDTESLIVSELEEDILDCESTLRDAFNSMSELDCILSLANCATDFNFIRPEVVGGDECCVYIQQGKHPLQELIIEGEFIPNDVVIDSDSRVNIVTGPNYSGKSCYLRQVGVLVYMAHVGSFVSAKKARISITDQIFARISTVETCAVPQSSFQLDLTQMATILRQGTPRSLVLIDEFGKGMS